MENLWDSRFKEKEYVYGTLPNVFFKNTLDKYNLKGSILLPAEGEGRNAVYAAQKGLDVFAFDTSIEGKNKAVKLAQRNHVSINYEVGDFFELELANERFDAVAFIYAHFSPELLPIYHKKAAELLKPNGMIIIEGFSKNHIEHQKTNPTAGGPKDLEMLFSVDTMKRDFPNFEILKLEETEEYLEEGKFHKGKAKLIQFVGRKRV